MKKLLFMILLASNMAYGQVSQEPAGNGKVKVVRMADADEKQNILVKIGSVYFLIPAKSIQVLINSSKNIKEFSVCPPGSEEYMQLVESSGLKDVAIASAMIVEIGEETVLPSEYAKHIRESIP